MYYKVSRDPVFNEVFLYPLEIIFIDTKSIQRLRFLSQLVGAENVYPSASHTRLAHSMGTMHIAGMYSNHLFKDNYSKIRILRLAGLVHDIGHGPFSHQFDDTVYKKAGYKDGHDDYRKRMILEYLPDVLFKKISNLGVEKLKKCVLEDLEKTTGSKDLKEGIDILTNKINEVFEGEHTGSIDFNILQGPLGADRLEFVLRDSFFAGTRNFGSGYIERIIRSSKIKDGKLIYDLKVIDDIYSVLFSRFMMYKNVYFHKTSRASDLLLQEILNYAIKPLRLIERVKNIEDFLDLTDNSVINEITYIFKSKKKEILKKLGITEEDLNKNLFSDYHVENLSDEESDLFNAYKSAERYKCRNLWKCVYDNSFSVTGFDPSVVSQSAGMDIISKITLNTKKLIENKKIEKDDEKTAKRIINNSDLLFKIDTPYKLSLSYPEEFLSNNVELYDNKRGDIISYRDFEDRYPSYKLMTDNLIQIVRIYCTLDIRPFLKKYKVVPGSSETKITTRW